MTIRQVIYQSRATREMSDTDLGDLLDQTRRLNSQHDITGLLLYIDFHFMQCIEGPPAAIEQLVSNIKADDRNESIFVLLDREIARRAFPEWTMGYHRTNGSELKDESCFQNIVRAQDLDQISRSDESVFKLMRNFYEQNAGRSFG